MQLQATISKRNFRLEAEEVQRALQGRLPDPIRDHYVVIGGRRFPPKQAISVATGLDRADFTTHQARRVLSRLGFVVGRRNEPAPALPVSREKDKWPHQGKEADLLRQFRGQWVAQRGLEVMVAAPAPETVIAWLETHNQQADAVFLVPSERRDTELIGPA